MNERKNVCKNESLNEQMNEKMNTDECSNLVKIRSINIAHAVTYVIAVYYG